MSRCCNEEIAAKLSLLPLPCKAKDQNPYVSGQSLVLKAGEGLIAIVGATKTKVPKKGFKKKPKRGLRRKRKVYRRSKTFKKRRKRRYY